MNPVVIVGAGPYGLSLASHLRSLNVTYRIFGTPMQLWKDHMPPGMVLKSGIDASDLYDPKRSFTLNHYYRENGRTLSVTHPIETENFVNYGLEFQKRLVPDLCTDMVTRVEPCGKHYRVQTSGNESIIASAVVIAVGVRDFAFIPEQFRKVDKQFLTHSSEYGDVDRFKGKDVAVIGAGASAIDLAIALQEANAHVTIIARRKKIRFHVPPKTTLLSRLSRIRYPYSPIGIGWRIAFCAYAPSLVHRLPVASKHQMAMTYLGAAPGWSTRERAQSIETLLDARVVAVETKDGRARVVYERGHNRSNRSVHHVILATGYRPDISRLSFLDGAIAKSINTIEGAPVLSATFETSSPGLYAIGPIAASSFGPIMRFVYGAGYTSRIVSRHLRVLSPLKEEVKILFGRISPSAPQTETVKA